MLPRNTILYLISQMLVLSKLLIIDLGKPVELRPPYFIFIILLYIHPSPPAGHRYIH